MVDLYYIYWKNNYALTPLVRRRHHFQGQAGCVFVMEGPPQTVSENAQWNYPNPSGFQCRDLHDRQQRHGCHLVQQAELGWDAGCQVRPRCTGASWRPSMGSEPRQKMTLSLARVRWGNSCPWGWVFWGLSALWIREKGDPYPGLKSWRATHW